MKNFMQQKKVKLETLLHDTLYTKNKLNDININIIFLLDISYQCNSYLVAWHLFIINLKRYLHEDNLKHNIINAPAIYKSSSPILSND